jgi:hypothetical protein
MHSISMQAQAAGVARSRMIEARPENGGPSLVKHLKGGRCQHGTSSMEQYLLVEMGLQPHDLNASRSCGVK